jgi:hypothetical protein
MVVLEAIQSGPDPVLREGLVRTHLNVVPDMLGRQVPAGQEDVARGRRRHHSLRGLPVRALEEDLVDEPAGAAEPGDQTTADVSRVFPNPAALDRLTAALLTELDDGWQGFDGRYFSEASMAELFTTQPISPEPQITPQPESKQLP